MTSRAVTLTAACAAFWVLTALPARHLGGELAAVFAGVAVLLCLGPALLTLAWASWAAHQDRQQATMAVLGSSGVRMFGVLLIALILYLNVPPFRGQDGFLYWVLAAYLFTLAVEVLLLVRDRGVRDGKVD